VLKGVVVGEVQDREPQGAKIVGEPGIASHLDGREFVLPKSNPGENRFEIAENDVCALEKRAHPVHWDSKSGSPETG
jgi:hypothetical protein